MKTRSLFDYADYKAFLRDQIAESSAIRGYQSRLADAAGCQRSFLSQVLNADLDLSREHAVELCRFWHFDPVQTEYFVGLVDLARAGTKALRAIVQTRLQALRSESADLKQRLKSEELAGAETQATYYSSWYWTALHLLVGLAEFQSPPDMAARLGLPLELVKATLARLETMGLVERAGGGWRVGKRDIHLPESSPMNEVNHTSWRQRAILNTQRRDREAVHYTSVFTMGRADAAKLRERLRAVIVEMREAIGPSPNEELFCFTADFFEV